MCPCSRCLCANSDLLVRQPRGQWVPALRRSHVSSQQNTGQWVQRSGFRSHAVTFVFSQWTLWLTQCWAGYLHLVATWYLMPSQPWRLCLGETRSSESRLKVWFSVYDMHLFCLSEYDFDHKKKREKEGLHELERQYFSRQNPQHKDVYSGCWNWAVLKSPSGCCWYPIMSCRWFTVLGSGL